MNIHATLSKICKEHGTKVRYCSCQGCKDFRSKADSIAFDLWVKDHVQIIHCCKPGSHVHKTAFKPFPVKWPTATYRCATRKDN